MGTQDRFTLAIVCGGPSPERGVSLNSARSVMDHLSGLPIDILPLYVDCKKQFHLVSPAQLYSNTPSDFDFKLASIGPCLNLPTLYSHLKKADLVFPVIHGAYGEDGQLQALLESWQIPFVGHSSESCSAMMRKSTARFLLQQNGFPVFPQLSLLDCEETSLNKVRQFFDQHKLTRAIVKPALAGSSIGVALINSPQEVLRHAKKIFDNQWDFEAIVEPLLTGTEFTISIFENKHGEPVPLIPTEVESKEVEQDILDYRKKYLPTDRVAYHTPPRFSSAIVDVIRKQAVELFKLFKMRDFVRIDGWVMSDGKIAFTDINPLSGLEQNSFLFQQAAAIGWSHEDALKHIIESACRRYGLSFPKDKKRKEDFRRQPVYVLFGSSNAERQVSLMSGTNVWLKLRQSDRYEPIPFFQDPKNSIWELTYASTLHHTVEEVYANCLAAEEKYRKWGNLIQKLQKQLNVMNHCPELPQHFSRDQFLQKAQQSRAFVFIALHGAEGENGTFQKKLEELHIPFNGSDSATSHLCMDKYETGAAITRLHDSFFSSLTKKKVDAHYLKKLTKDQCHLDWEKWCEELEVENLVIKPCADGCSAGVVLLQSSVDLWKYSTFIKKNVTYIPPFSFASQRDPVEMPPSLDCTFLLEPYIETDTIRIEKESILHVEKHGWIELTVGLLESKGKYQALNPSITVAEGSVLTLEEKFQGGTGVNLTPPPLEILSSENNQKIKTSIEKMAKALKVKNYARFDIFFNRKAEKLILIEVNSLPGLTPSTVIYHQGLAEPMPLTPLHLLEKIIDNALNV